MKSFRIEIEHFQEEIKFPLADHHLLFTASDSILAKHCTAEIISLSVGVHEELMENDELKNWAKNLISFKLYSGKFTQRALHGRDWVENSKKLWTDYDYRWEITGIYKNRIAREFWFVDVKLRIFGYKEVKLNHRI